MLLDTITNCIFVCSRMTSDVKKLIEEKDKERLQSWLTNSKAIIVKETKSTRACFYVGEDELAKMLLSLDLPTPDFYPAKTTGNGNCLYNAASTGLIGIYFYEQVL